jgi:tyrosine-protein kinase Etk/Wzc
MARETKHGLMTTQQGVLRRAPRPSPLEVPSAHADLVDVAQLLATLRQNYRSLFAVTLLAFSLVMAFTLASRMQFRSSGRLYLGELGAKDKVTGAAAELDLSGGGQGDLGSEIEIIRSRSLVKRAILDSGLNVTLSPTGYEAPRYWQWLLSKRDARLLDVAAREVGAVNTSFAAQSLNARAYRVHFVDETNYELWAEQREIGRGRLGEALLVPGLNLTLMPGTEGTPPLGTEYDLVVRPLDQVTDRVLNALEVTAPKAIGGGEPVKVVSLQFTEASPHLAAIFLEHLMRAYLEQRQSWKTEDATAAEAFVTNQLQSMREALDQIQAKLAEYRSNNRVVVLDTEGKAMNEQIGKYEVQRVAARLEAAALADVKRALDLPDSPVEAHMLGESSDTVLGGLAASLTLARVRLTDLESRFNSAAPELKEQRAQVDAQLSSIKSYVASRLVRSRENLATLDQIIGQFEAKLKTVPAAELGLAKLARESEVYGRLYSYLLERQQQTAIIKASKVSKNRVLDSPEVPYREDSPKLVLRVASAPLGLLLGVLIVLSRGLFAGTFQSESDVRRSTSRWPIFARVPRRLVSARRGRDSVPTTPFDVLGGTLNFEFVEAFRTLRANLSYSHSGSGEGETSQVVLVTSPAPGDGKTTCVLSLAAVLAANGKRVLVVDADLRRQTHHILSGPSAGADLRTMLSGECPWRDVVRAVPVSVGQFDSIIAGGMAPVELLSSARMLVFLTEARTVYDFVLLDTPSYPLVSDALILASSADCVLSVLRLEHTPRRLAAEHILKLSSQAATYALVLNGLSLGSDGSGYASRYRRRPPVEHNRRRLLRWLPAILGLMLGASAAVVFGRAGQGSTGNSESPEPAVTSPVRQGVMERP